MNNNLILNAMNNEPSLLDFVFMNFIPFLIGVIVGSVIIYQFSKDRIYSILNVERHNYSEGLKGFFFRYIGLVEKLKERKNHFKDENDKNSNGYSKGSNSNELVQIKKEKDEAEEDHQRLLVVYNELKEKYDRLNKSNDQSVIQPSAQKFTTVQTDKILTTYFSIPQKNGCFKFENGAKGKNDDTFYKIEHQENDFRADLSYVSGDLDVRAIDGVEHYLLPVCEIENIASRENSNRIELVSTGVVIKKEDSWMIEPNNKVKIKFS